MRPLLSRTEIFAWTAAFLVVAAVLVRTHFASDDPDSALYANISSRLAAQPPARWIAPEWWGNWDSEGLFHEHPVGVFLLPTLLGAVGIPAAQAAYIVGVGAGLACLVIMAGLIGRVTDRADARAALVLLQLMPVAFIFRIRANHEYPMLLALLVLLVALDAVRTSWKWIAVVVLSILGGLLVKGVFVVIPLVSAAWWIATNPTRARGSAGRAVAACLVALAAIPVVIWIYDVWYLRATRETFWRQYWERQLGPLTIATPVNAGGTLAAHLGFYALRVLWHPAPWSLMLIVLAWCRRHALRSWWHQAPPGARRGTVYALGFAGTAIVMLSPASRFAERYVFSANYAVAALGIVVSLHAWPRLRTAMERLDARIPALPVLTWVTLLALRLIFGPLLPRITS